MRIGWRRRDRVAQHADPLQDTADRARDLHRGGRRSRRRTRSHAARDAPGGGAVLVGGAIQLAVLFMSGNTFGNDGPALANELVAGAGPSMLARGKTRSIAITAAPLVVIGPILAAAITQEWEYLPAGVMVGVGGLLAGSGGAIVQSTVVPVAIPESDNPFAGGETGRGMMAALLLGAVLVGLAVVTLPVALALLWANARGSLMLVTLFGMGTMVVGWAVMRGGIAFSTWRLTSPRTRVHHRHHTVSLTDSVGPDVDRRRRHRHRDRGGRLARGQENALHQRHQAASPRARARPGNAAPRACARRRAAHGRVAHRRHWLFAARPGRP